MGGSCVSAKPARKGALRVLEKTFPGANAVPTGFTAMEEWPSFHRLKNDLHVLLETDSGQPAAWTRTEGNGRVFCTSLGHSEALWKSDAFRQMLLGAIQWTMQSTQ